MATIILTDMRLVRAVYAQGDDGDRLLIGYVDAAGDFLTTRPEHAALHRQKWGVSLHQQIEDHWLGRPIDAAS